MAEPSPGGEMPPAAKSLTHLDELSKTLDTALARAIHGVCSADRDAAAAAATKRAKTSAGSSGGANTGPSGRGEGVGGAPSHPREPEHDPLRLGPPRRPPAMPLRAGKYLSPTRWVVCFLRKLFVLWACQLSWGCNGPFIFLFHRPFQWQCS